MSCPTCKSPNPDLRPLSEIGEIVRLCKDPFHGVRCDVRFNGDTWRCRSAGCGASGAVYDGKAHDSNNPATRLVPIHEFSSERSGGRRCLFDIERQEEQRHIGNGDFSIGSPVWNGTSKLIEEMGELNHVLGDLVGAGFPAEHAEDLFKQGFSPVSLAPLERKAEESN